MTLYGDCRHILPEATHFSRALPTETFADIVCAPAALPQGFQAGLLLFESGVRMHLPQSFFAEAVLSCGMSARDTLSFSSISETSALLSLSRAFRFKNRLFEPMEVRVSYDPALSLYRNLTRGFVCALNTLIPKEADLETLPQCTRHSLRVSLLS